MAMLAAIAPIAQVIGAGVSALGTIAAGRSQREAGEWQAREYERQADSERATAQVEAEGRQRQSRLLQSRLQTVGAASGFSATDPTALNLTGEIERQGRLQADMATYAGEDRATGLRSQGAMSIYGGQAAETGAMYRAAGTILGGIGGLARYGDTRSPGGGNNNYLGWG